VKEEEGKLCMRGGGGGGKKYEVSGNDGEGRFGRHDEGIYGKRTSERRREGVSEEKKLLPPSTPRVYIIRNIAAFPPICIGMCFALHILI
jgi:hypothetical protein